MVFLKCPRIKNDIIRMRWIYFAKWKRIYIFSSLDVEKTFFYHLAEISWAWLSLKRCPLANMLLRTVCPSHQRQCHRFSSNHFRWAKQRADQVEVSVLWENGNFSNEFLTVNKSLMMSKHTFANRPIVSIVDSVQYKASFRPLPTVCDKSGTGYGSFVKMHIFVL